MNYEFGIGVITGVFVMLIFVLCFVAILLAKYEDRFILSKKQTRDLAYFIHSSNSEDKEKLLEIIK